jgi:hypothetical protein
MFFRLKQSGSRRYLQIAARTAPLLSACEPAASAARCCSLADLALPPRVCATSPPAAVPSAPPKGRGRVEAQRLAKLGYEAGGVRLNEGRKRVAETQYRQQNCSWLR